MLFVCDNTINDKLGLRNVNSTNKHKLLSSIELQLFGKMLSAMLKVKLSKLIKYFSGMIY